MTLPSKSAWTPVAILLGLFALASCEEMKLAMPPYDVHENDTYLCFATKLQSTAKRVVAIEPQSDMEVAHHMLLFGCGEPQNEPSKGVWECHMERPCKSEEHILYGWGRNAPKLNFPNGVGYSVGGASGIDYLVLQVHYLSTRPKGDASGVVLTMNTEPAERTTSMMSYMVGFSIPPGKESHLIDNTCCLTGFQPVTTMAFRVHTHVMGRSVYMTRTSGLFPNGTEIARNDPQLPQGFYPVAKETTVRPGEYLKVTCDFNSVGKNHTVGSGHTHDDEMCNMYMMTYSEVPHFVSCAGDYTDESLDGPGGITQENSLLPESVLLDAWKPPGDRKSATEENKHDSVGQVPGVAVADDGSVWILHRGDSVFLPTSFNSKHEFTSTKPIDEDVVMELDPKTGAVKRKWGKGIFCMPHMITVDYDGYVWVVDAGRHQVLKFNKDGELQMTVGTEMVPGVDPYHFCMPTHVQVLNDGRFLVSDGYCNSRVMVYDKNGKFIKKIEDDSLNLVHSIVVDECENQVLVASRENSMLVSYDINTGAKIGNVSLASYGKLWALTQGPYATVAALLWEPKRPATLLVLDSDVQMSWEIPDVDYPHDISLGAAPMEITGPENRLLAFYISETRQDGTSGVKKFISTPKRLIPEAATTSEESTIMVTSRNKKPENLGENNSDGDTLEATESDKGPATTPETTESLSTDKSQAQLSDEGHAAAKEAVAASNAITSKEPADVDEEIGRHDVDGPPAVRSHHAQPDSAGKDQAAERLDSHEVQTDTTSSDQAASTMNAATSLSKSPSDSVTSASSSTPNVGSTQVAPELVEASYMKSQELPGTGHAATHEHASNEADFHVIQRSDPPISPSGLNVKGWLMIAFPICALAAGYRYLRRRKGRRYQRLF